MGKKKTALLGHLELEIMKVIWEREDVTVAEVLQHVQSPRDLHHNTVMTVMKRLSEKGFLQQFAVDGRTKGYRALVSREQVGNQYIDMVRDQFFGGSTSETIAAFLGGERVSQSQLDRIKKMFRKRS